MMDATILPFTRTTPEKKPQELPEAISLDDLIKVLRPDGSLDRDHLRALNAELATRLAHEFNRGYATAVDQLGQ